MFEFSDANPEQMRKIKVGSPLKILTMLIIPMTII